MTQARPDGRSAPGPWVRGAVFRIAASGRAPAWILGYDADAGDRIVIDPRVVGAAPAPGGGTAGLALTATPGAGGGAVAALQGAGPTPKPLIEAWLDDRAAHLVALARGDRLIAVVEEADRVRIALGDAATPALLRLGGPQPCMRRRSASVAADTSPPASPMIDVIWSRWV